MDRQVNSELATREAALFQWFNTAIPGVTAYPETAVPSKANGDDEDAAFPYLTYSISDGTFGEETSITVNLWYYTENEALPNAGARVLRELLADGGVVVHFDGGAVWLKPGTPFSQVVQETDNRIKRRYINITVERISR